MKITKELKETENIARLRGITNSPLAYTYRGTNCKFFIDWSSRFWEIIEHIV